MIQEIRLLSDAKWFHWGDDIHIAQKIVHAEVFSPKTLQYI